MINQVYPLKKYYIEEKKDFFFGWDTVKEQIAYCTKQNTELTWYLAQTDEMIKMKRTL